jgi:hypothetical protein
MIISPALQAQWDQERRMIADHIRSFGVHLTYVYDEDDPPDGAACACCAVRGADDRGADDRDDDAEGDSFRDLVIDTGGDPDLLPPRTSTPFCYTTGLFGVGHAELVVHGLERAAAARTLDDVAHRVLDHGHDLVPGQVLEAGGTTFLVEEILCSGMVFFEAHSFYDRRPWESMAAYQLVWADQEGRFPWDDGHVPGRWVQRRAGEWRA